MERLLLSLIFMVFGAIPLLVESLLGRNEASLVSHPPLPPPPAAAVFRPPTPPPPPPKFVNNSKKGWNTTGGSMDSHQNHHRRRHPVQMVRERKINKGKKIGLLFVGIGVILQGAVVVFLGFTRWQIQKIKNSDGNGSS